MEFMAGNSVRLKATSELLYIVSIDKETATAFCQSFGASSPEGDVKPFPLDGLRENVRRDRNVQQDDRQSSSLRKLACGLGLHGWTAQTYSNRPVLKNIAARSCRHCGLARVGAGAVAGRGSRARQG